MSAIHGSMQQDAVADNKKAVGANVVAIAAGAGAATVVTPSVPQQGANVRNITNNWVRLAWTFAAGITAGGAAANRVTLIPPNSLETLDFGDHEGGASSSQIDPVLSVSVTPVTAPVATAEAGTLVVSAAATAGLVLINWISA
jgi:hypothetical protein